MLPVIRLRSLLEELISRITTVVKGYETLSKKWVFLDELIRKGAKPSSVLKFGRSPQLSPN